jgi:hypothetical protein
MPDQDSKYDALVEKLRNIKPVQGDPGLLTDKILHAIGQEKSKNPVSIIVWLRPVFSAAALLLLALFLYQLNRDKPYTQTGVMVTNARIAQINSGCWGKEHTVKFQGKKDLVDQYLCCMTKNRIKNEAFKEYYIKQLYKSKAFHNL